MRWKNDGWSRALSLVDSFALSGSAFLVDNRLYWFLGILSVVAVGMTIYRVASSPTEVETIRVQTREVIDLYIATGRVQARRTSDLGVEVAGTVQQVLVEEGDEVEKGDRLIVLRSRNAELAVQKAEAHVETLRSELQEIKRGPTDADIRAAESRVNQFAAQLAQAERELKDTKVLFEGEVVSEREFGKARTAAKEARAQLENAEAQLDRLRERPLPEQVRAAQSRLKQARVDLERARNDLAETIIRAPFDGLILTMETDEGERVTPNQTVARMADMTSAEVYAEVDEDYFGRLAPGQPASLLFPSMNDETFSATVRRVGPEVAPDRGVIGVHLAPDSLPDNAFPGLTVDANIEVARLDQALAAPTDAVVRDPRGTYVLTVEDGKTVRQAVDVRARGDTWMALEDIEAGTRVVRNAARLEIGQAVILAGGGES